MKWTDEELVVRRAAQQANLVLVRTRGEQIYNLIDRATGEPLKPDRPMTLQEAREECALRNR